MNILTSIMDLMTVRKERSHLTDTQIYIHYWPIPRPVIFMLCFIRRLVLVCCSRTLIPDVDLPFNKQHRDRGSDIQLDTVEHLAAKEEKQSEYWTNIDQLVGAGVLMKANVAPCVAGCVDEPLSSKTSPISAS